MLRLYQAGFGLGRMKSSSAQTKGMDRAGPIPDRGIEGCRVRTDDLRGVCRFEGTAHTRQQAAGRWRDDRSATAEASRHRLPQASADAFRTFRTVIEASEAAR